MTNHLDSHDIAALEALDTARRACLQATDSAVHAESGSYGLTLNALRNAAAALLGDQRADTLLEDLSLTDHTLREALHTVLAIPQCHVVMTFDHDVVGVYADEKLAHEKQAILGTHTCYVEQVNYVPAVLPELPSELDLDMLAADMANMFSHYGYAADGLDVDDIRPYLHPFLAAVRAHDGSSH